MSGFSGKYFGELFHKIDLRVVGLRFGLDLINFRFFCVPRVIILEIIDEKLVFVIFL
jgi:hypothetical protein